VTGQTFNRHPGLLVLDEPRQQDIDPVDYAAMLQYLARSSEYGGQTIITSATPRAELDQLISSTSGHLTDIGEARLLQPDSSSDPLDSD
jgi:ABC-type multidrug transport system ATPase subunit